MEQTFAHGLLNEKEAAAWLHKSVRWLQESRCTGEGPVFIKIGRSVRYRMDDLVQFIEERRQHSTAETASAA